MEYIIWNSRVKNKEVLHGVKEEMSILRAIKKEGYLDWSHLVQELPSKTHK